MAFQLNEIVPWGRSFQEYEAMFTLSGEDLNKRILGCGDGPASFNAELTRQGGTVVSVDPLYTCDVHAIRERIDETFAEVMQQTLENQDEFVWQQIPSVEQLGKTRMAAMRDFLSDYPIGKEEGRYLAQSMPTLSFSDGSYDLALCSHFLFLYSGQLDLKFHIDSIAELCRVSREVRIFPLLQLGSTLSPHVHAVIEHFQSEGYEVRQIRVAYEFQKGGNEMLQIKRIEQGERENAKHRVPSTLTKVEPRAPHVLPR